MKKLYICERPYNLYRTLLKAVNSDDEMDILISDNVEGLELMLDELKKSNLFKNVYYFDDLKHAQFSHPLKTYDIKEKNVVESIRKTFLSTFHVIVGFFQYLKSQRKAKYITLPDGLELDRYDEIHITDCTSILNFYLYHIKYPNLIYVEHAKDALQGSYPKITDYLAVLAKLRIVYGVRGSCRYIRVIEVNENKCLIKDTKGKEIREIPLQSLIDALFPEQKEFIYQLYAKSYNLDFRGDLNIDVFLMTFIDGETNSEMFLHVCREVINKHMADADHIIIKPHPADKTDYSEIAKSYVNVIFVPTCISAEIFALSSTLKIRKLINIDTSAVSVFNSIEEVLTLGFEFVVECRKSLGARS